MIMMNIRKYMVSFSQVMPKARLGRWKNTSANHLEDTIIDKNGRCILLFLDIDFQKCIF